MKREKIRAVILGHAVADALGVPVEFHSRECLDASPVTEMIGYGSHNVPAGSWSDDTSMVLAALDGFYDGEIDYDSIMQNLVAWIYEAKYTPTDVMFDVGGTCLSAIRNYAGGTPALMCGLKDSYSNGNGSLMRVHPFVLLCWLDKSKDLDDVVKKASSLTHAHERSVLGCKIYARVLLALLNNPSKAAVRLALSEAREELCDSPEYSHYERLFESGFENLPRESIKSSGYVVDSLEAAVWCLLTTESYRDCALKAVNLGEDTDTVAAIAGGLAGALYGTKAIPEEWLGTLKRRGVIEALIEKAFAGLIE